MSNQIRPMIGSCLISLVAVLLWSPWALGVQNADPPANKPASTPADDSSQDKTYSQRLASWKKLIAEMSVLREEFVVAEPAKREELTKDFNLLRGEGQKMALLLEQAATREYRREPNRDVELAEFLFLLAGEKIVHRQFEAGDRLATLLIEGGVDQLEFKLLEVKQIYRLAGWAKYALGDWKTAAAYLEKAKDARLLGSDKTAAGAYRLVHDETVLREFEAEWKREQELRAAEAKADDLPRVVLRTTRGDIVLELFENEAPNTVANFISLVEEKFYDGLVFHRVLPRNDQGVPLPIAQGGDPKGDGSGGPGYRIKCECGEENHRTHFRGSISMAHSGPNTGGSQFFLCFVPTVHLNGRHTVFGRVIEGLENMSNLRGGEKVQEDDKIIVAHVIRKRDHQYVPSKLSD